MSNKAVFDTAVSRARTKLQKRVSLLEPAVLQVAATVLTYADETIKAQAEVVAELTINCGELKRHNELGCRQLSMLKTMLMDEGINGLLIDKLISEVK